MSIAIGIRTDYEVFRMVMSQALCFMFPVFLLDCNKTFRDYLNGKSRRILFI